MGPQQSSSPLLPLLFQSRLPLRCAPSMGLSQRQARFRGCGEALAPPKNLRDGCIVAKLEPITEEDTMVAIPKIVGVMSCGVLLCLGLSGNAVSAVDVMKAGHAGERIGGQAGRGYEQGKREHVATHDGERIGGQAGLSEMEGMGK